MYIYTHTCVYICICMCVLAFGRPPFIAMKHFKNSILKILS